MDQNFKGYRHEFNKLKSVKDNTGIVYGYDEALEEVRTKLADKIKSVFLDEEATKEVKNKETLRKTLGTIRSMVSDVVFENDIRVRGYESHDISKFIEEVVHEIGGYSILNEAFENPKVSDIFCLSWDAIFVEENGENKKYHKTFRNAEHFENTLKRFLRVAGKEINQGDNKIVDFEMYGDRGCATSPSVSPKDYSLTIRKHSDDHVTRDQLIADQVMNEKLASLFEIVIWGESNLIYAGLTGSGKTTSIRAILDYTVTKLNKRMLVCEDTQELFSKNEHTLSLVSFKSKSKNESQAVPLSQLIITALRLKPKYIIVGEVRGEEAGAAVEGMETGHSTIFTMHGGTPWNIVNRLVTKYMMAMPSLSIDVVERIIGCSVDYIAIQDNIPGIGRKCTSLTEISYDFDARRIKMRQICRFDFKTKDFVFENFLSMEKAEVMMRRGVPWEVLEPWLEPTSTAPAA